MTDLKNHTDEMSLPGILQPKTSNRFVVSFTAVLNEDALVHVEEAEALFRGLSSQVISIQLPKQPLNVSLAPNYLLRQIVGFDALHVGGPATIVFEDDVSNVVLRGINLLDQVKNLKILVSKTDSDDKVIESYILTGVKLDMLEHGSLSYGTGRAIHKTLTVSVGHMHRTNFNNTKDSALNNAPTIEEHKREIWRLI